MTPDQLKAIKARYEAAKEFIDLLDNESCLHDSACGFAVVDLHPCIREIERLRADLDKVRTVGHNDDCLLCGMKDGVVDAALDDVPPDEISLRIVNARKALEQE